MSARDAVEKFLDDLFDHLAGTGAAGRRALIETEDHLRSAAADFEASGMDSDLAAERAVQRFGDARRIAGEIRVVHRDLPGLVRQLAVSGWILGGIGAVAVGLSGLLAQTMQSLWGASFVAGDIDGVTYTAGRCADFIGFFPGRSCEAAAALHHAGETALYREALGVLGLVALAAYVVARRTVLRSARWRVPVGLCVVVGGVLFGLAACAFGGQSLLQLAVQGPTGVGAFLSAGLVAGVFAVGFAGFGLRLRSTESGLVPPQT
jgi:hypothetical protein